ncbi:DNA alkylation repair protein [Pseudomonas sp. SWRI59]|uniref:DNA alkylation repair protein n=1 Tax=Pseudomonas TaxID=286 RepID=UPI00164929CB|nr:MULTISPECIES: DNA alkylation repair protein [unclassified Pseudomonas]MBC3482525.1 DNA alkylation repair protein [Pseudomonas sp. SWRI77]MBC3504040.1 DNA alkylation repair protein [Pseudomonas sp. SWRI59]MBC3506921.1 DNA alkylation repair protein [Pseudomonas sp. SWRI68]UVL06042.1 DNA alkylation repair protein [Pseudomonas sp. B21-047]
MSDERKTQLDHGLIPTRNLAECLAVDQLALATAVAQQLPPAVGECLVQATKEKQPLGLSKKIAGIGLALGQWLQQAPVAISQQVFEHCGAHPSDTVRSWAAFAQAHLTVSLDLQAALAAQLRFARDPHFGVREWAWIALRPRLSEDLPAALALLGRQASSEDPLERRFCIEVLRPRGVWCEHITALKQAPEAAEALLVPHLAESEKYPQDSVANWLNDASKTRPDWVLDLFERHPPACKASRRIQQRATRSLTR